MPMLKQWCFSILYVVIDVAMLFALFYYFPDFFFQGFIFRDYFFTNILICFFLPAIPVALLSYGKVRYKNLIYFLTIVFNLIAYTYGDDIFRF